jgi:Zn-dependent peptidase ImmA (M78 family)
VLRSHGLETIPVDPVVLANRLGISVHNAKFSDDNLVGMIAKRGGTVTMLINATDPPFRKRFTIAHELGHHFLHLLEDGDYVDGEANLFRGPGDETKEITPERRREIQANMFAAALLMPEDAVREHWPRVRKIESMARLFNVSEAAMGFRVTQLGLA